MTPDTKPLVKRIDALVKEHGSLRNVGIALEIDPGFLSRIRTGKVIPGAHSTVLEKLGLRVQVTYKRVF